MNKDAPGMTIHRNDDGIGYTVTIFGPKQEPDSNLIAAAPDLLYALETLLEWTAQYGHEEENALAEAAIAKAKGEE